MTYEVITYSTPSLIELLAKAAKTSVAQVNAKQHISYFHNYFSDLGASTIVAEFDYIDHDYIEDYSSYYVKCFHDYGRKCVRIHFFQHQFNKRQFSNAFRRKSRRFFKKLGDSYLGFIVVKPLPITIVGRTCLKTYPFANERFYPITRSYKASLFGLDLQVKTLAYQEQDQVAAACATSALWSVFHGTGILFQHSIPSPIEITKAALEKSPAEMRNLPNKGLTLEQLGHAIRDVNLDPFLVKASNEHVLKSTAYGYLRAGIPIYFSIRLVNETKWLGGHGVALAGYRLNGAGPRPMDGTGFLLKASRMEKIYVHDDQIGPFAKMEFDGGIAEWIDPTTGENRSSISLSSSWFGGSGRAVPNAILIPLYHKIRIPYEVVHDMVLDFDAQIETYRPTFVQLIPQRIEWDIFLSQVNTLKDELLDSPYIQNKFRENIVTERLPKHLWRAIGILDDKPIVELTFDATDIEQGNVFIRAIPYNVDVFNLLVLLSSVPAITARAGKSRPIFNWFSSQTIL